MDRSDYAIYTEGLTKKFGNVTAVSNLNLSIPQNGIYAFIGSNGAGKTTTLKMLTGLTRPTSGTIFVNGKQVECGEGQNTGIGYLPDVPGFYGWMTAKEYLVFCSKLLGYSDTDCSVMADDKLKLVELDTNTSKIKGFSRGMKQRLGIAQALIGDPKVVFLDEPASALDPAGRKEIMDLLLYLKNRLTIFFSTHIINDAQRISDRVLLLNKGSLILDADIKELLASSDTNSVALSVISADTESIKNFESDITKESWYISHTFKDNEYSILCKEITLTGKRIPEILVKHSLAIKEYKVVNRDLESIFLNLTGKENNA